MSCTGGGALHQQNNSNYTEASREICCYIILLANRRRCVRFADASTHDEEASGARGAPLHQQENSNYTDANPLLALESCPHAGEGLPCCPITSSGTSGAANGRAGEQYQYLNHCNKLERTRCYYTEASTV